MIAAYDSSEQLIGSYPSSVEIPMGGSVAIVFESEGAALAALPNISISDGSGAVQLRTSGATISASLANSGLGRIEFSGVSVWQFEVTAAPLPGDIQSIDIFVGERIALSYPSVGTVSSGLDTMLSVQFPTGAYDSSNFRCLVGDVTLEGLGGSSSVDFILHDTGALLLYFNGSLVWSGVTVE